MKAADFLEKTYSSFTCLALVKINSNIARDWKLSKPAYCIFEYSKAFGEVMIRWGDGSWQRLEEKEELNDLILLDQFCEQETEKLIDDLFDS